MKRSLVWVLMAALLLVAAIVFVLQRSDGRDPATGAPEANATETRADAAVLAPEAPLVASGESLDPRRAEAAPVESAPPPATAPADDGLAELRGRFLLPDGSPATGVRLQVRGFAGNSERLMQHGKPESWQNLSGTTDAEGRFSFRFDPPLAFQFMLEAEHAGHAKVAWRWFSLPPRAVTDVGDVALARAGSVRGRIVDTQGKPVPGDWRVYADSSFQPPGEGGDTTRVHAPADAATGEFLLEGLPPGPAELKAHSRITNWIDGPSVVVAGGETASADIVYDGPDNSRRIVVVTFCKLFHTYSNPAHGSIVALGGGAERQAEKVGGSSQSWSFNDLEPGSYTIEVRDPRYKPWSQGAVSPGSSIDAKLEGSSAVVLAVVDDAGVPVEDYRLRLRFRNVNFMPNEFELRAAGAPLPPGGLYGALIPSDFTLRVEAPGFPICEVDVDALAPGETRAVSAELARGVSLRGSVLDGTTRAPVADVQVRLSNRVASDAGQDPAPPRVIWRGAQFTGDVREARTDARGRFEFASVAAGEYELRATLSLYVECVDSTVEVEQGRDLEVDLILPACGYLAGRLLGPPGGLFDGLGVDATPKSKDGEANSDWMFPRFMDEGRIGSLDPDGAYRVGPLLPGEVDVVLLFPESRLPLSFSSSTTLPGARKTLGTATIEGGKELQRDFDLRDGFPGSLRLAILVDGAPGAGLVASVESLAGASGALLDAAAAQSDAKGIATLGPLAPGEWRLLVRPVDSEWWWSPAAPVRIAAGAETSLAVGVALIAGSLLVVADDDGKPLANRRIQIRQGESTGIERMADAEGRVQLRLPIGTFEIADGGDPAEYPRWGHPGVRFEWTASGAAPPAVRVPRAPKGQPLPDDGE